MAGPIATRANKFGTAKDVMCHMCVPPILAIAVVHVFHRQKGLYCLLLYIEYMRMHREWPGRWVEQNMHACVHVRTTVQQVLPLTFWLHVLVCLLC